MPAFRPGRVSLARALSKLGVASRTEADRLVRAGRVTVRGRISTNPGLAVSPERDEIAIDGVRARRSGWRTIAFHKPRGVVTTRRDPEGRPTVFDALGDLRDASRLRAVGRLDLATSGLLLLTTDTQLADWLIDPANEIPRTYVVTSRGRVADEALQAMQSGVMSRGERLKSTRVQLLKRSARETHLLMELTEGRNREVRRLIEACGGEVTRLKRIAFGRIELADLPPGHWRDVTRAEVQAAFPAYPRRARA